MSYQTSKRFHFLCLVLASLPVSLAQAAAPVYFSPTSDGNQAWPGMLGNDFAVTNSLVQVSALGAFTGSTAGFANGTTVKVGLFDVTDLYDDNSGTNSISQVIAPITFTGNVGTVISSYAYQNVTPTLLTNGHVYSIQASGFNSNDQNFNTNIGGATQMFETLGGALVQKNGRYAGSAGLGVAGTSGSWSFGGGSALVAVVPEAEIWAMMLTGLGIVGVVARRRKTTRG
ncbi:hypothetical protein CAP2UW1_0872 [Candidatus Accumulibacter phosphatis]|jgi:hypothetical protein|uniref:PEP-CTERM protein-sorting domain-containing protein n=1 Tax=Accumulibacter regalis TaxID=522306 RepID=C7RNS3_ACCRE|nr:PEP-CTERM sorting domain-containing protein [Accumulibacter sp.]MBO3714206.1 hypothetical protein [Accumulibacter sp.]